MEITLETLDSLKEKVNVQLVDVRSAGEFAAGHVPGAVNIPMEQVEARLADLSREGVVLLCQSGRRASMTCEILQNQHPEVKFLKGGTVAWKEAGRPLVSSQATRWSLERQVRLGAGTLILLGLGMGFASNPAWFGLTAFVGVGLAFAGLTDICGMAFLLAKMPWNKSRVASNARVCSNN